MRIFEVFWVKHHSALLTTPYGKQQQKEYSQHGFHRYFSALRIKHCIDCVMLSYFWNKGFHKDLIIYAVGNFVWELWKRLREVIENSAVIRLFFDKSYFACSPWNLLTKEGWNETKASKQHTALDGLTLSENPIYC